MRDYFLLAYKNGSMQNSLGKSKTSWIFLSACLSLSQFTRQIWKNSVLGASLIQHCFSTETIYPFSFLQSSIEEIMTYQKAVQSYLNLTLTQSNVNISYSTLLMFYFSLMNVVSCFPMNYLLMIDSYDILILDLFISSQLCYPIKPIFEGLSPFGFSSSIFLLLLYLSCRLMAYYTRAKKNKLNQAMSFWSPIGSQLPQSSTTEVITAVGSRYFLSEDIMPANNS